VQKQKRRLYARKVEGETYPNIFRAMVNVTQANRGKGVGDGLKWMSC
jgi:hypothetical protein